MINIAIVEDDALIREGLRMLIDGTEGFGCVGTYVSAEDAIERIASSRADVVLMDIHLPGVSGIECVRRLKAIQPEIQVMMLTMYDDDESIFNALMAGATGYLVKKTEPARLLEAVTDLHNGGSPMSNQIARRVVQSLQQLGRPAQQSHILSKREQQILEYLARGYRYKEIAGELFISIETVRTHIRNIYEKLQVRSRTEAVMKAMGRL